MPSQLVRPLDIHPVESVWLDLFMARACVEAAAGTREQFVRKNRDTGSLTFAVPIPGT